jgi:hypothetical protein
MKKLLSVNYPWDKAEKGQGFFVPCLDTETIKLAGLNSALAHRIFDAKAFPAIREGLIGVWFYRTPSKDSGRSAS